MSDRTRRLLALSVLVVAGLASLATSQSYTVDDSVDGRSFLGADGASLSVVVTIPGPSALALSSDSYIEFQVIGNGGSSVPAQIEAQIVPSGTDPSLVPWLTAPAKAPLTAEDCPGICVTEFTINLRTPQPELEPVVVPWRAYALSYESSAKSLTVSATPTGLSAAPSLQSYALPALAVGALLGCLLALASRRMFKSAGRATRVYEWLIALSLVGVGLLGARGFVPNVGFLDAAPMLATAGIILAICLVASLRLPFLIAGLIPIGGILVPAVLSVYSWNGEFRPLDLTIAAGVSGATAGAAFICALALMRTALTKVEWREGYVLLAAVVAAVLYLAAAAASIAVGLGTTGHAVISSVGFGAAGALVSLAMWRYLSGDSFSAVINGIFVVLLGAITLVVLVIARVVFLVDSGFAELWVLAVSAVLFAGGILLGIVTAFPPPNRDRSIHGRPVQTSWAEALRNDGDSEDEMSTYQWYPHSR